MRGLFRAVDFIGVSAYAGIPRTPSIADLETSLHKVDQELSLFGMSLKGLGKELIFSEYGIGGGMKGDYSTPAPNSAIVAASPYWGVGGMYSASNDPWRVSDNRRFLQQYYRLTTEYARRGGVAYPVGGASPPANAARRFAHAHTARSALEGSPCPTCYPLRR